MPTIEIDDKVWDELKKRAVPLEDTPNSVLRRILGLNGSHNSQTVRSPIKRRNERIPQNEYRGPILTALSEMDGSGYVRAVLNRVGELMADRLNDIDRDYLPSGNDIRWRNAAQWERQVMVNEGLLKKDCPRGIWELTEEGLAEAQRIGKKSK